MSGGLMNTRLMQLTAKRIRAGLDHNFRKLSTGPQPTAVIEILKCEG